MTPFALAPFALMLAAATQAAVALPAEPPAKAAAGAESPSDKPVCRRVVETGSIMAKKVCKTREEWAADAARGEETLRRARSSGGIR